ncbi:phosphoesterase [Desulfuromonas versatilis]|uniref:Phosphoesterase n=1 Tax=Desulfuromonas versatilis TaxID=2802975 RepID=A0ABM8HU69_9BACT|nr:patatin-like phospholipase family protein [Desulfuromonas versatilis]BCR04181.1 phosphoesterase [Desulfuromonas versatilis]
MNPQPSPRRTGLALGSGAARGMAHIGVLKALEAGGVKVDVLSGTSFGAFIGALYAAGVGVAQMEEVARGVDWQHLAKLLDPTIPTSGLIDGRKLTRFMAEMLPARTFEELKIPLGVVATDVETGEAVVIRRGNLLEALRASVAFPGIFTPVPFGERFLIDGGLLNPVPVDVAYELGAEVVIGVCAIPEVRKRPTETFLPMEGKKEVHPSGLREFLTSQGVEKIFREILRSNPREKLTQPSPAPSPRRKPPGIFRIFAQSVAIMENQINALQLDRNEADLVIRPDLNGITLLEFNRAAEAIRAGELETRARMPEILRLVGG